MCSVTVGCQTTYNLRSPDGKCVAWNEGESIEYLCYYAARFSSIFHHVFEKIMAYPTKITVMTLTS